MDKSPTNIFKRIAVDNNVMRSILDFRDFMFARYQTISLHVRSDVS